MNTVWHTTDLDRYIAEEFFGWRWLAYHGRPTRSAPDYPKEQQVRRFFPPDKELHRQWFDYFAQVPHTPATGNEPLCYSYCSSNGPHDVPHFSGDLNEFQAVEKNLEVRGLLDNYDEILSNQCQGNPRFATCEERCIAALAAIGSKYV